MQYNQEVELAMIGAVLRNSKAFQIANDIIQEKDFYYVPYQWAWQVIKKLSDAGMGIDVITVGDELERENKLAEFRSGTTFSGRAALAWARDNTDYRNAETYASEILDYSAKRQIEQIFTQGVNWSQNGRRANEILADVMHKVGDIKIKSTPDHKIFVYSDTIDYICIGEMVNTYQNVNVKINGQWTKKQLFTRDLNSIATQTLKDWQTKDITTDTLRSMVNGLKNVFTSLLGSGIVVKLLPAFIFIILMVILTTMQLITWTALKVSITFQNMVKMQVRKRRRRFYVDRAVKTRIEFPACLHKRVAVNNPVKLLSGQVELFSFDIIRG